MTADEFCRLETVDGFSPALQALWHDKKGNWDQAHELAQAGAGTEGDWVHAYLHRKEGDEANAGYWYARARRAKPKLSLDAEWTAIVNELLRSGGHPA